MDGNTKLLKEYDDLLLSYQEATEQIRCHLDNKSWTNVRHWVQVRAGLIREMEKSALHRLSLRQEDPALWKVWSDRWNAMLQHIAGLEHGFADRLQAGIEEMKNQSGQVKKVRKAASAFAAMQGRNG